jgi:hypothetical protein
MIVVNDARVTRVKTKRTASVRTVLSAALIASCIALTGCTTVLDEAVSAVGSAVGPKAEKRADGTFVLPEFSVAETGATFSAASPEEAHNSLVRMTSGMSDGEKIYLVRVFSSLGFYHGCKDRGRRSHFKNPFKSTNLGVCNMRTFYTDSHVMARNLITLGRPDARQLRTVQDVTLVSNTPIGQPYQVGWGVGESWTKWIDWSGHRVDGMTRSDMLQAFLQETNGLFGTSAQLRQRLP